MDTDLNGVSTVRRRRRGGGGDLVAVCSGGDLESHGLLQFVANNIYPCVVSWVGSNRRDPPSPLSSLPAGYYQLRDTRSLAPLFPSPLP